MRATILAIGDELVLGQSVDSNSAWLSEQFALRSIETLEHRTVPDDRAVIAATIEALAAQSDVLVMTGGLGPTDDDLTRFALGDVLTPGRDLVLDAAGAEALEKWFAGRGRVIHEANLVQAKRPEPMRLVPNPNGTAPGLAGEHAGCAVFALPGPPREMRPMFEKHVAGVVTGAATIVTATVHEYGLGESDAATRLGAMTARDHRPLVGTTASSGIVTARIRAEGAADETRAAVDAVCDRVEASWAPYAFGRGDLTLAQAVGAKLRDVGETVATAESCTGGWVGKMLVDDAGASDYYRGGWVTYSNELKTRCLDVPADRLATDGAVSAPVAVAMAAGALRHSGASCSVSITGIAGPGGAVPGKPRGTVFIGVARRSSDGAIVRVRHFRFRGERQLVRDRSAKSSLQMLRFALLDLEASPRLLWEAPDTKERVERVALGMTWQTAYIAIGSNLGDRAALVQAACASLTATPSVRVGARSRVRETEPVGGPAGQGAYLNAVVEVTTTLEPRALLERCLAIEVEHGRDRTREERWGPRRLDLDLLLFGDRVLEEPGLTLPHPRLHERAFVLEPLAEIAGGVVHPVLGKPVESLWKELAAGEPHDGAPWTPTCDGTLPTA